MPQSVVVTFERKNYTFDGKRWYGTDDHMVPPQSMIHKLIALLPPTAPPAKPKRSAKRDA